jgi:hypothetical protein
MINLLRNERTDSLVGVESTSIVPRMISVHTCSSTRDKHCVTPDLEKMESETNQRTKCADSLIIKLQMESDENKETDEEG